MDQARMLTTEPMEPPEPDDYDDALAEPEEPEDLDPAAWLARDESDVVGFVLVRGGKLKVGALTQREMDNIRRLSSKINPRTREMITDNQLLSRRVIAHALSKANGTAGTPSEIQPEQLDNKLTGDLTEIARKILQLSGFIADDERDDELPFGSPR